MHKGKIRGMKRFLELKSVRESWPGDIRKRLENPEGEGDFMIKAALTGAETYQILGTVHMVNRFCDTPDKQEKERLRWILLYLMNQSGNGHIRISLKDLFEDFPLWYKSAGYSRFPGDLNELLPELLDKNPRLFGRLPEESAPVLRTREGHSFYLLKRWRYEKRFLQLLEPLIGKKGNTPLDGSAADEDLSPVFQELSQDKGLLMGEDTLRAARMVSSRLFSVITGGPGTGKTTILSGMLRLILETRARKGLPLLNIRLCAPTGRAAGRMEESLKDLMVHPVLGEAFQISPSTLHKLLGLQPGHPPRFNRNRPLPAELIVVDEASMVDLNLMYYLLDALKPGCRILLVGDKDQLPSVEAGALLSDFLYGMDQDFYRLKGGVLSLSTVHRNSGAILEGASLVIHGRTEEFLCFLKQPERTGIPGPGKFLYSPVPGFRDFLDAAGDSLPLKEMKAAYPRFDQSVTTWEEKKEVIESFFRLYRDWVVLVPSRKGLFGINSINRALSRYFAPGEGPVFHGQPIMISRNDYERGLFNGDRGVILEFQGYHYAFFEGSRKGEFRHFPVTLLGEYQTAFALTIHKSQGSEYKNVTVVIPEGTDRLLSREILYTGITRARETVLLYSRPDLLEKALSRGVRRQSGIREFMVMEE